MVIVRDDIPLQKGLRPVEDGILTSTPINVRDDIPLQKGLRQLWICPSIRTILSEMIFHYKKD